jgi:hypothetical protein
MAYYIIQIVIFSGASYQFMVSILDGRLRLSIGVVTTGYGEHLVMLATVNFLLHFSSQSCLWDVSWICTLILKPQCRCLRLRPYHCHRHRHPIEWNGTIWPWDIVDDDKLPFDFLVRFVVVKVLPSTLCPRVELSRIRDNYQHKKTS